MMKLSPLKFVHIKNKFGNYQNSHEKDLLKISEITNLNIFQLVKFKNSNLDNDKIKIDNCNLPSPLKVCSNDTTRVLWIGPNNWLITSLKLDLFDEERKNFDDQNFALTNISHSRTIIEVEGDLTNEVLKKGCPLNINEMKMGDCANSLYNSITITIDFISDNPKKIRIFGLRSFGESLYHSITDPSLVYGYIGS